MQYDLVYWQCYYKKVLIASTEVAFTSDAGSTASSLFLRAQIREIELVSVCLLNSWSMMLFVCTPLQALNFHGIDLAWLHGTQNVSFQMGQISLLGVVDYFPFSKQKMFLKIIIIASLHCQRFQR